MVLRFVAADGTPLLVGQTAAENDGLCKRASQLDLWFHLDNQPSPHVILQLSATVGAKKGGASANAITDACQLCKAYSKGINARSAQSAVIYIEAKHVGKGKEDPKTGQVQLSKAPLRRLVGTDEAALARLRATMSTVDAGRGGSGGGSGGGEGGAVVGAVKVEPLFAAKLSKAEKKAAAAARKAERAASMTEGAGEPGKPVAAGNVEIEAQREAGVLSSNKAFEQYEQVAKPAYSLTEAADGSESFDEEYISYR